MTGRRKAIAFFITLGACLVAAAVTLNVSWIMIHWRRAVPLVLGIIVFAMIIAGITVYTVFLVREIRRSEQQDSFINAVTHELKTPITSIRLYLETIQSRELSEAQKKEFFSIMLADTDRLLHTVDMVLKAGVAGLKKKREFVSVDLTTVARDCAELACVRHHLSTEALILRDGAPVSVMGDSDDLHTAISNLLDNAVKYSGDKVAVDLQVVNGEEGKALVKVKDHGVGIPRNQLNKIFQRFYRAPGRTLRQVAGTGLGLYIVRSIAKKHGGRAFAESEGEGKGATFTLELPKISG